jgi:hypothetical protein
LTLIFFDFISDDPPYPRHPRSIDPYTELKTALDGELVLRQPYLPI